MSETTTTPTTTPAAHRCGARRLRRLPNSRPIRLTARRLRARIASHARRLRRAARRDDGMSTAEYAVGTVAAVGFGAALYKVVTSDAVADALTAIITRALNATF